MDQSFMARYGGPLVAQGYPVIPIIPGAKAPGQYRKEEWRNYPDWSRHCDRATTQFELDIWKRWPDVGVGIACGKVIGVDLDVMDAEVALKLEAFAFARLGETPAMRIGQMPKRLLVYRAKHQFPPIKRHPIEILARGSQFVAYAVHPTTGEPYLWPNEELADLDISMLPEVDEVTARAFAEEAWKLLPSELRQKTLGPDRSADHYYSGGEQRGTIEAVTDAMAYIPNDDVTYDDWIRIGLALKGALGDGGLELWEEWSARSSKHGSSGKTDTCARTWRARSFNPREIGAGTIYYYATEHGGWCPDSSMILSASVAEQMQAEGFNGHPAAEFLETLDAAKEKETVKVAPRLTTPEIVLQPGGLLDDIMTWMLSSAIYPQPLLALAAAICAVGTAAGRRYAGPNDIRTNVYCVGIAESGSGKEHQTACLGNLFFAADMTAYLGAEELSSGTAVESAIIAHAVQLFRLDEFGQMMKSVMNPRASSMHRRDILVRLTKYTGSANRVVRSTAFSDRKAREERDIVEPCVCLYATTVSEPLWQAFDAGALKDGSVARMLFFRSERDYPQKQAPSGRARDVPQHVADGLKAVVGNGSIDPLAVSAAQGLALASDKRPDLVAVDMDDEAVQVMDEVEDERRRFLEDPSGDVRMRPIFSRWCEHVVRLATISAISRQPMAPLIGKHDVAWARATVAHCLATLSAEAAEHMADTEAEATKKKVLRIIAQHGPMTQNELTRRTQFLKKRERMDVISDLVEGGQVTRNGVKPKNGGPLAAIYSIP